MQERKIYIGLNDSITLQQKFDTSKYMSILKNVCMAYHVPFSFSLSEGGYIHENGFYVQEKTLIISMIDVEENTAEEIAKDLCAFFHQESVLMTVSEVKSVFIKEKL